jgi:polyisoprenoid-binding protein YceI
MRLNASCLLQRLTLLTCAALLSACPAPPRVSPPAPAQPVPGVAAHVGTPYTIVAGESLLTIRVYKGGAFAAAGHNHVIASHALSGIFYAADAPLQSSFEVHVPLESLSVDEAELRAQAGPDFPPEVPETAREGTRRNMLGPALLDAENDPEIVLSAVRLVPAQPPQSAVQARVQARVRGAPHEFDVLVRYERSAERLVVSGDTVLKQSELGLKPFSALLGALQVQDEMRISFRIVAHPGFPTGGANPAGRSLPAGR